MTEITCQRCDEPVKREVPDMVSRMTGRIVKTTYTVHWTTWRTRPLALMRNYRDGIQVSNSELTLCSECWGGLLTWANQPEQERLKIAAENRRYRAQVEKVAAERREQEIQALMTENQS
jgi:hypothetical protein